MRGKNRINPSNKLSILDVKKEFESRSCILIDTDYKDSKTKISYKCKIHNEEIQHISYDHLTRKKVSPCSACKKINRYNVKMLKFETLFYKSGLTIISTEAVQLNLKSDTRINFICDKHNIYGLQNTTYEFLLSNSGGCKICTTEKRANSKRRSISEVKQMLLTKGYSLLDEVYLNSKTKMRFICIKHPQEVQYLTMDRFRENIDCCSQCQIDHMRYLLQANFEVVKQKFINQGFIVIDDTYFNSVTPIKCYCINHPNKILYIPYTTIMCGHGCRYCFYERNSGENCHLWNGGITPEDKKFRGSIEYKLWRKSVFVRDNYTCQACSKIGGKLHAHHIQNYSSYIELRTDINNGITLCENCHHCVVPGSFHNIYGTKNNTLDQLLEFISFKKQIV
jgi:hypothetical protein